MIFKYHYLCRNFTELFCFYDSSYLCICHTNHTRVQCFRHDPLLDHCDLCVSGGQCVRGDLNDSNSFLCLCPYCYQGRQCQFSLQPFGFTLDLLIASDTMTIKCLYNIIVFIIVIFGAFNNFCSFLTFKRPRPRRNSVGIYLLQISILNQLTLFCLMCNFIHILLASFDYVNDISCKIINYILFVLTRSAYWLSSWVTIDGLAMVLFPTVKSWKDPRLAIKKSLITFSILFGLHIHDLFYYVSIKQIDMQTTVCVTNFNRMFFSTYDRINSIINSTVPCIIQVISISLIIVRLTRSRANIGQKQLMYKQILREQFKKQKELFIIPITIIFSSLPQVILAFILACTQMSSFQRHIFLISYLFSYIPHTLGFILYVLPSHTFKKEFSQTSLAKRWFPKL